MIPTKNLPMLMNLAGYAFNRGLPNEFGQRGDFQPIFNKDGSLQTSFCNQAMQYICNGLGYDTFNGMNANEMIHFMSSTSSGWISVVAVSLKKHANLGVLVLAGHANLGGHGHVNLIVPGVLEKSSSYGKAVPKCMNVGKDVFWGRKISFAFSHLEMPTYFALCGMI